MTDEKQIEFMYNKLLDYVAMHESLQADNAALQRQVYEMKAKPADDHYLTI